MIRLLLQRSALLVIISFVVIGCAPDIAPHAGTAQRSPMPNGESEPLTTVAAAPNWACAPKSVAPVSHTRLYVLHSIGKDLWKNWLPAWGNDPAERGPTHLARLDPETGATLAADAGPGVGFSFDASSNQIVRMVYDVQSSGNEATLRLAGFEVLSGSTLQRVRFLPATPLTLFPAPQELLQQASVALVGGQRLVLVQRMAQGGPASMGPVTTAATCLDMAKSQPFLGRVMGNNFIPRVWCGLRDVVRPASDGSLVALTTPCAQIDQETGDPGKTGNLQVYRIDPQGHVTHFDLPFFEFDVPFTLSPDAKQIFVANPREQELYAIALTGGHVLWKKPYGQPAPTKEKVFVAPNQIEISPDGSRLYLISNDVSAASPGVWVIDARTGRVLDHLLQGERIDGIAVSPTHALYVVSPDGGGRLWILPHGDPHEQRLLRHDLGDNLSGVMIGP